MVTTLFRVESLALTNAQAMVRLAGLPGYTYQVQRATSDGAAFMILTP